MANDISAFSAAAIMQAAECRPFLDFDVNDQHDRLVQEMTRDCEMCQLPFSQVQIANAAWKRVPEALKTLTGLRYCETMTATMPAYAKFQNWWLEATADFLKFIDVVPLPPNGKQKRYGLTFRVGGPSWTL